MKAKSVRGAYFMPITRTNCACGSNRKRGSVKHQMYVMGEYVSGKFRSVEYFCSECFDRGIAPLLSSYVFSHGEGSLEIRGLRGCTLPAWIAIPVVKIDSDALSHTQA